MEIYLKDLSAELKIEVTDRIRKRRKEFREYIDCGLGDKIIVGILFNVHDEKVRLDKEGLDDLEDDGIAEALAETPTRRSSARMFGQLMRQPTQRQAPPYQVNNDAPHPEVIVERNPDVIRNSPSHRQIREETWRYPNGKVQVRHYYMNDDDTTDVVYVVDEEPPREQIIAEAERLRLQQQQNDLGEITISGTSASMSANTFTMQYTTDSDTGYTNHIAFDNPVEEPLDTQPGIASLPHNIHYEDPREIRPLRGENADNMIIDDAIREAGLEEIPQGDPDAEDEPDPAN